jgi:hypothetical protein
MSGSRRELDAGFNSPSVGAPPGVDLGFFTVLFACACTAKFGASFGRGAQGKSASLDLLINDRVSNQWWTEQLTSKPMQITNRSAQVAISSF